MGMEYNGWKLLDNILIVISAEENIKYNCKQGYIVDPKSKKQLESALAWGRSVRYDRDEAGNPITNYTEADVIETDNKDFTLQLLDSSGYSSQGGRLSFWNCLITKGNIKCVVGINSELLLELMMQSTFTNGLCNKKVCFARKWGSVGVLHTEMTQYSDALADEKLKKNMKKGKTSKWKVGHTYDTVTKSDVYLGQIYSPLKIEYGSFWLDMSRLSEAERNVLKEKYSDSDIARKSIDKLKINIDKNRKLYVIDRAERVKQTIKDCADNTFEDYMNTLEKLYIDNMENKFKEHDRPNLSILQTYQVPFESKYVDYVLKTKPSRVEGKQVLKTNQGEQGIENSINHLYSKLRNNYESIIDNGYTSDCRISHLEVLTRSSDGKIADDMFSLIKKLFKLEPPENQNMQNIQLIEVTCGDYKEAFIDMNKVCNKVIELLK